MDTSMLLERARAFVRQHAEASASGPGEYPGTLEEAPHVELVEVLGGARLGARFCGDFAIRYGGQAGSDSYDHVIVLGRVVTSLDGALIEATLEHRGVEVVSEAEWEGIGRARFDRRAARARFLESRSS
jgi:hypothetical protein